MTRSFAIDTRLAAWTAASLLAVLACDGCLAAAQPSSSAAGTNEPSATAVAASTEPPTTATTATLATTAPNPSPSEGWTSRSESLAGAQRWSMSRGSLDLGLGLDATTRTARSIEPHFDGPNAVLPAWPSVSVGLRRTSALPAASLIERAVGPEGSATSTSRLGIEWKPASSQLLSIRQGLGIRLSGDDRLTMRLRKGSLGIYMKRDF